MAQHICLFTMEANKKPSFFSIPALKPNHAKEFEDDFKVELIFVGETWRNIWPELLTQARRAGRKVSRISKANQ